MCFADPAGQYIQTNAQIQNLVNTLAAAITGTDAATVAMSQALSFQSKLLLVSANYPMVDPYNPAVGFNTRKADLLNAINTTWVTLNKTIKTLRV